MTKETGRETRDSETLESVDEGDDFSRVLCPFPEPETSVVSPLVVPVGDS